MKKAIIIQIAGFLSLVCVIYPPLAGLSQTDSVKKDTVTSLVLQGLRAADSANKTFDKLLSKKNEEEPKVKVEKVYITKKVEVPKYYPIIIHDTVHEVRLKYIQTISKKEAQRLNKWYTDSLAKLNKKIDSLTPKKKKHHKV